MELCLEHKGMDTYGKGFDVITESNGREIFVAQVDPWEIDAAGRLVLTRRQAKALAEHIAWQLEGDAVETELGDDEDG